MRFLPILLLLAAPPVLAEDQDLRSIEVVRYDCTTDTTRRELTLFANGTVRLREGWIGNEWMGLTELGPDELQAYLNRLGGEDLSESANPEKGVEGAWIERCELRLRLSGKPLKTYRFGHYDPLPLNLSRVVRIAQELVDKVPVTKDKDELPADYDPKPGDVLKRGGDGALFRVIAFTADDKGVELRGVDLPLEVYVPRDHLRESFTELVSRDR
ncbi:MAG TPA: hypothetical protein VHC97_23320 [Thermoanaerobaculia bacterium]|jgi:hypothetical protein|nr:hypothetical protein [Thermoanaerobaculia bacterium]